MREVTVKMKLPVTVRTYLVSDPDVCEQEFVVDYATPEGRKRIARHSGWALNNGRGVETEPMQ